MRIRRLLYFILLACGISSAQEWVVPDQDVQTIFFQGMMESQRQCAKYCGKRGMIATTGETVVCHTCQELIRNPYIGKELDEIMLQNGSPRAWYNPLRLIDRMQEYGFARKMNKYGMQILGTKLGMPTVIAHAVDVFKLNFGQERDIAEHAEKVARCEREYADTPKILWGVSRGAAATLNAYATNQYDNVKMLVLEGCFDTVTHTIEGRASAWMKKYKLHVLFNYFLSYVTEYKLDGISPLVSVDQVPAGVPIVFITSQADTNVPQICTDAVVEKIRARGQNDIHYLVLADATHNVYAMGDGKDQKRYRLFLHRLYKRYNLPYVAEYADYDTNA